MWSLCQLGGLRARPIRWTPTRRPVPRCPPPPPPPPKTRDGRVEAIRVLRVARRRAVKAGTQGINQLKALLLTVSAELREQLRHLTTTTLIATCARLGQSSELTDSEQATKTALRRLARRYQHLSEETAEADTELRTLVTASAPRLLALPSVGIDVAGQLLTSAGDNPDRLRSQAAFAHLCGVAPVPASSARTHHHRLNRGGDPAANNALYIVVLARLRYDCNAGLTCPGRPAAGTPTETSSDRPANLTRPWLTAPQACARPVKNNAARSAKVRPAGSSPRSISSPSTYWSMPTPSSPRPPNNCSRPSPAPDNTAPPGPPSPPVLGTTRQAAQQRFTPP